MNDLNFMIKKIFNCPYFLLLQQFMEHGWLHSEEIPFLPMVLSLNLCHKSLKLAICRAHQSRGLTHHLQGTMLLPCNSLFLCYHGWLGHSAYGSRPALVYVVEVPSWILYLVFFLQLGSFFFSNLERQVLKPSRLFSFLYPQFRFPGLT